MATGGDFGQRRIMKKKNRNKDEKKTRMDTAPSNIRKQEKTTQKKSKQNRGEKG